MHCARPWISTAAEVQDGEDALHVAAKNRGKGVVMHNATKRVAAFIARFVAQRSPTLDPRLADDQLARCFHETRERLAPRLGLTPRRVEWDDVPIDERLLTAAALRELADRGALARRSSSFGPDHVSIRDGF